MQDYRSTAVLIHASLVNTHTHTGGQTVFDQLFY